MIKALHDLAVEHGECGHNLLEEPRSETAFPHIYNPPPAPMGWTSRTSLLTISVGTNDTTPVYKAGLFLTDGTTTASPEVTFTFSFGPFRMVSLDPSQIPNSETQVIVRVFGAAGVVSPDEVTIDVR